MFLLTGASAWSIDKLGHGVDPEGVQDGGNQFNHASWGGTTVSTVAGTMTIKSLDAPNVNPMTDTFPIGNPLPASIDEALSKSGKGVPRPDMIRAPCVPVHTPWSYRGCTRA